MRAILCLLLAQLVAPQAPEALQPPKDRKLLFHLEGKGSQIYVCQQTATGFAWTLKAPDAKLIGDSGKVVGRHFAGPTWAANDGSQVKGKVVASSPSPDPESIPWLLLTAVSHDSAGSMAKVESIQRLNTKGGKAPPDTCDAGKQNQETPVPYSASYYFYGLNLAN